jgi:outer membrane protein TolC
MRRRLLALLEASVLQLLATVAVASMVGEPPPLVLDDAIQIALANNHHLKIAGAEARIAEAALAQAAAPMLPQVEVSEWMSWTTNPILVFGQLLAQESFTQENFAVESLNQPEALTNFTTRLTVSQPLWTGGRLRGEEQAAYHRREAALCLKDRTRQQVIHEVVQAYSGAILARARLNVAQEARATARAHVKLVSDLREAGLVVESDLLSARVRESELEEMVITAAGVLEVADAGLNLAMGRPQGTPLSLPAEIELGVALDRDTAPTEDIIGEALRRRPDLGATMEELQASRWSLRQAGAARRGELGVTGALEASEEKFIGASGSNWALLATFRLRLYDGGTTRARLLRAREQQRKVETMKELLEEEIALEVRRALTGCSTARQRLVETEQAVELARESLRIVQDRYQEGLVPLVDLLEAEDALTRARSRQVAASRDLFVARSGLDLAVGRL